MIKQTSSRKYVYQRHSVVLSMTDRDVVERAAGLWDGGVYRHDWDKRPNQKPLFTARTSGAKATQLMEILLPSMGDRRSAKIKELLNTKVGRIS